MSELIDVKPNELNELKKIHDLYATTHHILCTRIQFYAEEFEGVKALLDFYKKLTEDLKLKIEELEPKEEPKAEAE
jgi:hypothetical protein